jgi:hypothetical protein
MKCPGAHAAARSAAMLNIGTTINFRGRLHVVVGVTPFGVTPCVFELRDVEDGRVRSVQSDDPELSTVAPSPDLEAEPDV